MFCCSLHVMSDRSAGDFSLLSLIMTSIYILGDFQIVYVLYIWLLLKLFFWGMFMNKENVYTRVFG